MMSEIFAQGERVPDVLPSGTVSQNAEGAAMVLAEDEASGHRNAIRERVTMFATIASPQKIVDWHLTFTKPT
jgi:hypothetical protein